MQCASAGSALAESLVIVEEKKRMQYAVDLARSSTLAMPIMTNFESAPSFKPGKETKKIQVDPAHPERTVTIGAGLRKK